MGTVESSGARHDPGGVARSGGAWSDQAGFREVELGPARRGKVTVIEFTAVARPVAKGSHRGIPIRRKGGRVGVVVVDDSPRVKPFAAAVAAAAAEHHTGDLIRGPVAVDLHFVFARPLGHYGTGRNADRLRDSAPSVPANRASGDVDKLSRAVLDALEGVIYADDAQVVDLRALKHYGSPACVHVAVTALRAPVAA